MIPRVVLGVAAVLFLLLPWPDPVSLAAVLSVLGAVTAVWAVRAPGSLAPLYLLGIGVLSWLSAVLDPGLIRIMTFATVGYVAHSAAALASGVPAGAPVAAAVLRRWALSTVGVLLAGWAVIAVTALLARLTGSATLVVVGMLAAVMLVALPRVVVQWARQ